MAAESKQSSSGCCPPGSLPSYIDSSYTPKGKKTTVGTTDTYVVGTSRDPTEVVILFPDVWGWYAIQPFTLYYVQMLVSHTCFCFINHSDLIGGCFLYTFTGTAVVREP